jgi:proteic killer suppression protein
MIESFGDKATETLWKTGKAGKGFPVGIKQRALDMLQILNAATRPDDLRFPPGNRLEQLGGKLAGFWSIRVNKQWRIVFRFAGENAQDVAIMDYH